ncbi:nickel-dependent hydrogenase large subunit [uncultured Cohaesibacter sp.]|uniref:nickel-dependent hydrogenase large subunit n=1 Tax=uncultured Cohaesibacter sp. TaxID=1002546 RepID=UPI0029C94DE8|nr:nickel-dependent hydrogenase large subunit [uncultured Cohaesibacter sp.]
MSLEIFMSSCADGGCFQPTIKSNRRTDIAQIFVGLPADQVPSQVPHLFYICGMAHRHASKLACGLFRTQREKLCSEALVLAEMAREHCLHVFTHWQTMTDKSIGATLLRGLIQNVRALEKSLAEAGQSGSDCADSLAWFASRLEVVIEDSILGNSVEDWQSIADIEALNQWAGSHGSQAALYFNILDRHQLQGIGAIEPHFLRDLPDEELTALLLGEDGKAFAARPEWDWRPCETGPLARYVDTPLVASIRQHQGAGLLARQVARLSELLSIPDALREVCKALESCDGKAIAPIPADHTGLGVVETARGRLVHAARIKDGEVAAYQILAPTEWNFHPDGAAASSLARLKSDEVTETNVNALLHAIDPCVGFQIFIDSGDKVRKPTDEASNA